MHFQPPTGCVKFRPLVRNPVRERTTNKHARAQVFRGHHPQERGAGGARPGVCGGGRARPGAAGVARACPDGAGHARGRAAGRAAGPGRPAAEGAAEPGAREQPRRLRGEGLRRGGRGPLHALRAAQRTPARAGGQGQGRPQDLQRFRPRARDPHPPRRGGDRRAPAPRVQAREHLPRRAEPAPDAVHRLPAVARHGPDARSPGTPSTFSSPASSTTRPGSTTARCRRVSTRS